MILKFVERDFKNRSHGENPAGLEEKKRHLSRHCRHWTNGWSGVYTIDSTLHDI